jgi:TPR repeat protein
MADPREVLLRLQLAAEQGGADFQHDLGSMYLHGRDVEKDEAKAVRLFAKAAEQGCAKA